MSETNSAGCGSSAGPVALVGVRQLSSSSSSFDCSFGSPLQVAGATQRDERELASWLHSDAPAVDRVPFIEPETVAAAPSKSDGGAVAEVLLETRGITSQKNKEFQRELWCRQTIHKNTVAAKLRSVGRADLSETLESCHSETTWCICKGCKTAKPFLNRCERFYCPECQPTLSRDRERSVGWWSREMQQPKHVVVTLVNEDNLTKNYVKWAKACFAKLRRRKFAANWIGGFYNWEVTKEKAGDVKNGHVLAGGYHLHCHALVEAKWIDVHALAAEWQKVTGGKGRIVYVKDARQHDYLKEVTKYAVKGNQLAAWTGEEIAQFIDAFTGVRTFGVFGSLYGKRTEFRAWIEQLQQTHMKCKCGCTEFWYQSDFDYIHGELIPELAARPPTAVKSDIQQLHFSTLPV